MNELSTVVVFVLTDMENTQELTWNAITVKCCSCPRKFKDFSKRIAHIKTWPYLTGLALEAPNMAATQCFQASK